MVFSLRVVTRALMTKQMVRCTTKFVKCDRHANEQSLISGITPAASLTRIP